jgi:hypothetical protein
MQFCKKYALLLCSLVTIVADAQEKLYTLRDDSLAVKKVITAAAIHFPGIYMYQERRLALHTTFMYGVGIYFSSYENSDPPKPLQMRRRFMVIRDDAFPSFYEVSSVTPYIFSEVRQYFGFARRVRKEKDVTNNAANYVALFAEAPLASGRLTETTNIVMAFPVGIKIGMRRNLAEQFYFEGSAGFLRKIHGGKLNTANVDKFTTNYMPRLKIDFGYVF